ncbi:hypothetical protein BKI52_28155 [marine bacterium AO1-C]|nr:hypothetical protein BKI52_28155 [marine bacterium AO1-C]
MRTLLLSSIIVAFSLNTFAQSKTLKYNLKKGQAFDILLLRLKPNTKEKIQKYFKTYFPIAKKYGYHSLKGFPVKESPMQGNYQPQSMIFGYWDSLDQREKFLEYIDENKPEFHQDRRDIWTRFDVTYYEMQQDVSFEVNKEKYNVVTAYWQKKKAGFKQFKKNWQEKVRQAGGTVVVTLTNGASPFGYYYNPDYLCITEWESKAAFEKFYQKNLQMDHSAVQQVNQFKIF